MSIIEQLRGILEDQREVLTDVRKERKELKEALGRVDEKEIEILVGIEKTKEALCRYGEKR